MSFKDRFLLWLAEYPGSLLVRLLGSTLRIRIHGRIFYRERQQGSNRRGVHGFWHCHIIPLAVAFRNQGACVMISEHRDGEVIARVAERLGFTTIRGSTTRGGVKALKAILRLKKDPSAPDIAITPDGPRGPARKVQGGAVFIASKTGWPLVPVGVAMARHWTFNSWDRFQVPKPFSRCAIVMGEEIEVEESLTEAQAAAKSRLLEERMQAAEKEAFAMLENWNG